MLGMFVVTKMLQPLCLMDITTVIQWNQMSTPE